MTVTINLTPDLKPASQSLRQGDSDWLALLHQPPPVATIDPATGNAPPTIRREDLRREKLYGNRA